MAGPVDAARPVATGPGAREAWLRLARGRAGVRPTQTPAWLDCVRAGGDVEDATRLYVTPGGREVVLPLARRRRPVAALSPEDSWPEGWEAGGLLADGPLGREDVAAVVSDLRGRGVLRTGVRVQVRPEERAVWDAVVPSRTWCQRRDTQVLDLDGGFDTVWRDRFTSKVRSTARKAVRRGVTVESDAAGRLVPEFDALYRQSVDRWARERNEPVGLRRWLAARREPVDKWAAVAAGMGESCRVWLARREGHAIAAIVVLTHGDQAYYWRGAMDKERVTGTGANELLHCSALEEACAAGVRQYDLGVSPTEALARFKAGFGPRRETLLTYRFERVPVSRAETWVRETAKRVAGVRAPEPGASPGAAAEGPRRLVSRS